MGRGRFGAMLEEVEALSQRPRALVRRGLSRFASGRALMHVVAQSFEGPLLHRASAMAFDLFLGAIPLLALAGWFFGHVVADGSGRRAAALLLGVTPVQVQALADDELSRSTPEMLAPLAVLVTLWLGSSACGTCMDYLERRIGTPPRPWWKRRLLSLAWVTGSLVVFIGGSALVFFITGGPVQMLESLVSPNTEGVAAYPLSLLLLYGLALLLLAGFYWVVLPHQRIRRRVFIGAALGIVLFVLVSSVFALYVASLAKYALYYGSLAAVAVTMAWLWLMCFLVLAGAEFLVSYEEAKNGDLD